MERAGGAELDVPAPADQKKVVRDREWLGPACLTIASGWKCACDRRLFDPVVADRCIPRLRGARHLYMAVDGWRGNARGGLPGDAGAIARAVHPPDDPGVALASRLAAPEAQRPGENQLRRRIAFD